MNTGHEAIVSLPYSQASIPSCGVAQFLQKNASVRPNHAGAFFEGKTYTYAELNLRAQAIAAEMLQCGVKHGDRVGLFFPNHPDYISAFFAATGIGATVIPINPLLKSDEIAHILKDSKSKAVILHERGTDELQRALAQLTDLTHVVTIAYEQAEARKTEGKVQHIALLSTTLTDRGYAVAKNWQWNTNIDEKNDLALIVYTSGTTGKPKGAMLTHRNLMSMLDMASLELKMTPEDKFLVVLPLCHVYGLAVVMLGLFRQGGTLVVLDKFEAVAALKHIESEKVSLIPAVPAMYQFMLNEMEKNSYDVSSVRLCLSGAAAMPLEMFGQLRTQFGATVIEGYGLTETSAIVSINPIEGVQKIGSVGRALEGIETGIFSGEGKRLPSGKDNVGEIAARGPNIMLGYYERPEATAECIKDGWFFSGDLGYQDEDGYIFVVGRTKEMIIRGGQNIYPRELEEVIARMPGVAEVAVVGVPCPRMGERVKAVIALRKGVELTDEEVKAFCVEHMAAYKVPRLVEFIDALPRNSTGKVLKRLLQPA
ncbi:MAG TPA: long-chain-fatty-acid--CoA ligase [Planktothrix sp.]|jgi:long-chain acyl-CoA synthetase